MKLNLHIIKHDLGASVLGARIEDDPTTRPLDTVRVYQPKMPLDKQTLYISEAAFFENVSVTTLNAPLNLLCLGRPSEKLLESRANIIWLNRETPLVDVYSHVVDAFARYNEVHRAVLEDGLREKPMPVVAKRVAELFNRPLYIWDRHNEVILSYCDEKRYILPNDYLPHKEGSILAAEEIDEWNRGLQSGSISHNVLETSKPYYLNNPDLWSYGALNANVFIGNNRVGTLTVEEIGGPFDERDVALIDFFASMISSFVRRDKDANIASTMRLNSLLEKLLDRKSVPHPELRSALHEIGWNVDDPQVCIAATPKYPPYSEQVLRIIANNVCVQHERIAYATFNGSIVFIMNLANSSLPARRIAEEVAKSVKSLRYKVIFGCSTVFRNTADLHDRYRQAELALQFGSSKNAEGESVFFFDDCILESILMNVRDHTTPEILCPTGLMNLIQYDDKNKTRYTAILNEYLNCNMSTSETARRLFMHRNTLLTRLAKMRELLEIDLDDPDNRVIIMLALRAMGNTKLLRRVLAHTELTA